MDHGPAARRAFYPTLSGINWARYSSFIHSHLYPVRPTCTIHPRPPHQNAARGAQLSFCLPRGRSLPLDPRSNAMAAHVDRDPASAAQISGRCRCLGPIDVPCSGMVCRRLHARICQSDGYARDVRSVHGYDHRCCQRR